MRLLSVSGQRRFMLRFFDEPSNDPYVSLTMDVDLDPALAFLDAFERENGERAGVQHLVTAAVARCLHEIPALNVKIVGRAFYQLDQVDIVVPVRLDGSSSSKDQTGLMVLQGVERLSLREIAKTTRERSHDERSGRARMFGTALARRLLEKAPRIGDAALGIAGSALQYRQPYRLMGPWANVSTGVTNVGAVFTLPPGARFRAAGLTMPTRMGHVASAFAIAPSCEAPVAENGRVVVKRVLPIVMLVDHRAIDGFLMAKLGERLAGTLLRPEILARAAVS